MKTKNIVSIILLSLLITGCQNNNNKESESSESKEEVSSVVSSENSAESQVISSKESVSSLPKDMILRTSKGLSVKFNQKGARIESVDFNGSHLAEKGFIAGRVANRIAGASFTLNGQTYNVDRNDGMNSLHGGSRGFGEINWTRVDQTENSITFTLHSPDKDMGYPGNLDVTTKYTLSDDGELSFEISAISDKDTLFNPTNHLYMNMNGNQSNSNHNLWIDADKYSKTNSSLIPTGENVSVEGTTLDYRTKNTYHGNNDSNLVLNGTGYRKVAEMDGMTGGYRVEVFTDRVGLQLYSDGKFICMEPQDFPDAIHHDNFPSIVLEANQEYYTKSAFKFTKIN